MHATLVKLAAETAVILALGALDASAPVSGPHASSADDATAVVLVTPEADRSSGDPRPVGAAIEPGASLVGVNVGGGPLLVLDADQTVHLRETMSGHYEGHVDGMRLVDARGTDAGWSLLATASAPGDGRFRLHVNRIQAFAESAAGIVGRDATVRNDEAGVVAVAAPGNSGGAFTVALTVEWDAPDAKSSPPEIDGLLSLRAA